MSATTYTLELASTPPSLNQVMYRHWAAQRRAEAGLQSSFEALLMAAGLPRPLPGRVTARATLIPTLSRGGGLLVVEAVASKGGRGVLAG